MKNYWAFRIDKENLKILKDELQRGNLRQGWGFKEGQDLRNRTIDEGAKRNERMYNQVKKGDIILIPRIPTWNDITIARATEDWDIGYKYDIHHETKDHGHVFPAEIENHFVRKSKHVDAGLEGTFRSSSRFWNINSYQETIEKILAASEEDRIGAISTEDRTTAAIESAFASTFDRELFAISLKNDLDSAHRAAKWENVLVKCLQEIHPNYVVERTGGPAETHHGTDILVRIPSPLDIETSYGIAIQVKDYTGQTWKPDEVVNQIVKAKAYWEEKSDLDLILESWVVLVRSEEEANEDLSRLATEKGIRVLYQKGLIELLTQMALKRLRLQD